MTSDSHSKIIGGRYEINEVIGQGGFATVFKGRDLHTDEIIAVKLLKRDVVESDPGLVERFTREGEALRTLNHPSIVKAFAMIEQEGVHYAVMEYVSGGDLRTLLEREHKLPPRRVMEIALDLSDALARAHRLKIIHRDIKPANVLLAEDGTPRLTDFGIARFIDASGQTQSGQMMGTLAYLSPEACVGDRLDHRADIWALGIMLFEMLAGFRPFDAGEGGSQAALLVSILSQPTPSLIEYSPDAPPALIRLIERMLVKDREERIQSVRQVGAQLEAILAGNGDSDEDDAFITGMDSGSITGDTPPDKARTPTQKLISQLQIDPLVQRSNTPTPAAASVPAPASTTAPQTKSARVTPLTLVGGGLLLAVVLAAILLLPNLNRSETVVTPDAAATSPGALVESAPDGKIMILVAALEPLNNTDNAATVTRFIFQDLQQKLERDVRFAPYIVRQYPQVITSTQQALDVAEAAQAAVIFWGDYDGEVARVNVQLGTLDIYTTLSMTRDELSKITDARYLVTDPRRESLVGAVVGVMNAVQTANNSTYDIPMNLAVLNQLKPTSPEVDGMSAAAHWHRYMALFMESSEATFTEIDAAIAIEPGNPVLYLARSLSLVRRAVQTGDPAYMDDARAEVRTAGRLSEPTSIMDEMQLAQIALLVRNNPQEAITHYSSVLAIKPDDWVALVMRGASYFLVGDYARAEADINRSLDLNPDFPPAYAYALPVALHSGDFLLAQQHFRTLTEDFPDPQFTEKLLTASYGLTVQSSPLIAGVSAVSRAALFQWEAVLVESELSIEGYPLADLNLVRGIAYCNLEDYAAAEAEFTRALELDPGYTFALAMRAMTRLQAGNPLGAGADFALVQQDEQAAEFTPFIPLFLSGEITCANIFEVDMPQSATAAATPAN